MNLIFQNSFEFQYYLFLTLTAAAIFSQVPHSWWVVNEFSSLKKGWKEAQASIFCGILSVGIFAFVLRGNTGMALAGAIVEIIINIYYYHQKLVNTEAEKGRGAPTNQERIFKNLSNSKKLIRIISKNWVAYFLGIIIPTCVYIFSLEMEKILAEIN